MSEDIKHYWSLASMLKLLSKAFKKPEPNYCCDCKYFYKSFNTEYCRAITRPPGPRHPITGRGPGDRLEDCIAVRGQINFIWWYPKANCKFYEVKTYE